MLTCPDPALFAQALNEADEAILTHVKNCQQCQHDETLQLLLSTWNRLDYLSEIKVSEQFEARLQARLYAAEQPSFWARLDQFWQTLHVPAFAALIMLLFILPEMPQTQQAHFKKSPAQYELRHHPYLDTEKSLALFIKHYHRSESKT